MKEYHSKQKKLRNLEGEKKIKDFCKERHSDGSCTDQGAKV